MIQPVNKRQRYIQFGNRNVRISKGIAACYAQSHLEQFGVKQICKDPLDFQIVQGRKLNARQKRRHKMWGFIAAKHSNIF